MKSKLKIIVWLIALGLLWGTAAQAQTALPAANAGFDIVGFIQAANLNATPRPGVDPAMRGGVIWVNGTRIIVPDNSLVQFPASTWTWAQLFDPAAWAPVGNYNPPRPVPPAGRTGLALNDPLANHFPSYEVRVLGNIITDSATGTQRYVAALILPVVQQGLNGQSGYINFIDYDGSVLGIAGRFRIGGTMGNSTTGTLCELNDPAGRFGAEHSPDQRFKVDDGNPTVAAATGYPVGIPRVAPTGAPGFEGDPDRPYTNRPNNGATRIFQMPAAPGGPGTTTPDPWRQVPLMLGDWVDVSGTWMKINPAGNNGPANQFLSVHTLNAHLGIKTASNTNPAYIKIEGLLFGVGDGFGGPTTAGIGQETSTRVALVAFTTDTMLLGNKAQYPASIYAIDKDPVTGAETELLFPNGNGATNPDFTIDDTNRGRVRWTISKQANEAAGLIANAAPLSAPPAQRKITREYVLRLNRLQATQGFQLPDMANGLPGLVVGQYRLPIFDYIFGEGTNFGEAWPPFNFQDLNFLVLGEGAVGPGGAVVGPLSPFPNFE